MFSVILSNLKNYHYFIVNTYVFQCYERFNKPTTGSEKPRDYPLCSTLLKDAMDAAKDTPTCIRRSNLVTNLNPGIKTAHHNICNHDIFGINSSLFLQDLFEILIGNT